MILLSLGFEEILLLLLLVLGSGFSLFLYLFFFLLTIFFFLLSLFNFSIFSTNLSLSPKPSTPCSTQSTLPSIGGDTLLPMLLALSNLTFVCCNRLVCGGVFAVVSCSPRQQGCASQAIQGDRSRPVCLLRRLFEQSLPPRHIIRPDRATMPSAAFEDVIQRKCGLALRDCI